jgi:hypothetical protein
MVRSTVIVNDWRYREARVVPDRGGAGSCFFSNAALMADTICALEWPAITSLVRRSAIGNIDRAARRGILSTPLLALLHHLVQIRNRPYLNRSKSILKAWKL